MNPIVSWEVTKPSGEQFIVPNLPGGGFEVGECDGSGEWTYRPVFKDEVVAVAEEETP